MVVSAHFPNEWSKESSGNTVPFQILGGVCGVGTIYSRSKAEQKPFNLGPWIETFTGKKFHFLNPQPEEICIEDIAHALSNICRFTGHSSFFYSVAEHSIAVSVLTNSLEGLLHDASEAYITDISSPVKPLLANYRDLERRITTAIEKQFGLRTKPEIHRGVKQADLDQLATEAKYLIKSGGIGWDHWKVNQRGTKEGIVPTGYNPDRAEQKFLQCFNRFTNNVYLSC